MVCERWHNRDNFLTDVVPAPDGISCSTDIQEAADQRKLQYKTVNVRCYRGSTIAQALDLLDADLEVIQETRRPRKKKG